MVYAGLNNGFFTSIWRKKRKRDQCVSGSLRQEETALGLSWGRWWWGWWRGIHVRQGRASTDPFAERKRQRQRMRGRWSSPSSSCCTAAQKADVVPTLVEWERTGRTGHVSRLQLVTLRAFSLHSLLKLTFLPSTPVSPLPSCLPSDHVSRPPSLSDSLPASLAVAGSGAPLCAAL